MVNNNTKSTTGRLLSEDFAAKLPGLPKHRTTWHTDGRVSWRSCSCGWESARVNRYDALYVISSVCGAQADETRDEIYDILDNSGCSGDGDPQEDRDR